MQVIVLLLLCLVGSLFAEEPQDSARYTLPEQTVVGSRSEVRWLDNATATSALSKADQPTVRGLGISDNLLLIPGLAATTRFGTDDMRLSMRGMGMRSNSGERSVRILYDGIPESEPDGQTRLEGVEVGNLSQIEMLRGAGSSLYGNAAGGVLSLRTMEGFRRTGVMADVEGGGFGYYKARMAVGTASHSSKDAPTLALDLKDMKFSAGEGGEGGMLSVSEIKSDGWRDHSKYEAQLVSGSWKVHSTASSSLKALFYFVNAHAFLPGELTKAQFDSDPNQADSLYTANDVQRFTRKGRLGLQYDRAFGKEWSLMFTPYVAVKKLDRIREKEDYQMITRYVLGSTAQVQWNGNIADKPSRMVAGFDNQLMDGPMIFYDTKLGVRQDTVRDHEQERQWQMGGFAQGDIDLTSKWSATVGLRYEKVEIDAIPLYTHVVEAEKELEPQIIPRFGLRYKLSDETTLFASGYGGYETPTLFEKEHLDASYQSELKPQTSFTAELGIRGDRAIQEVDMQWEATLYRMMVSDYLMPAPGAGEKKFVNADQTTHQGIELSGKIVKQHLGYLGLAASAGQFKFDKFKQGTTDYKDKKIPGVPEVLLGAVARWTPRDFFYAELTVRMSGDVYATTENTSNDKAKSWLVLGGAIGGQVPVEFMTASWHLGVQNITDEKYASFVQVNDSRQHYYSSGMPMTVFGGISVGTKGL